MHKKILSFLFTALLCYGSSQVHATATIANLAALKLYTYTSGNELVYVQGYSTVNDGGEGLFTWDAASSEADNNGTVIQVGATSGRWRRMYVGAISVKWFGAKGDGATDDQASISHALLAALHFHCDLFLPGSTYNLTSYANPTMHYIFSPPVGTPGSAYRIRIFGEKKTVLTTALSPAAGASSIMFIFSTAWEHCMIDHIFFQNTHPLPADSSSIGQTDAILMLGSVGNNNVDFTIQNCVFEGFSTAITLNGTVDTRIVKCAFNAPKGRDNAQGTNPMPAVYIWAISNSGGLVINPSILDCYANGFSGTNISTTITRAPMDGFVYGSPMGGLIANNIVKNCGEELIEISPDLPAPDNRPVVISDNLLDCSLPAGTAQVGHPTIPSTGNYGIRCEAFGSVISGNTLYNATRGILQYAVNADDYQFRRWQVQDNVIQVSTNTAMKPEYGIFMQGFFNSSARRLQNPNILNNTIFADGVSLGQNFDAILMASADSAFITGNTFTVSNLTRNGFQANFCGITGAYNSNFKDNMINGIVDKKYDVAGSVPASTYVDWDNFSGQKISQLTAAATLTAENSTVLGNASAASFAVTLPSPSDLTVFAKGQGKKIVLKNITPAASSNTFSVTTPSGLIIGTGSGTTLAIASGVTVTLQTDGSNWYVL
ncbi:MAG TPA: hypothetical protein VK563_05155 [Puia sp.]|nr:hypothetical protein [Puia sp.]